MSEILGAMFKNLLVLLGVVAVAAVFWRVLGVDKASRALSEQTELQGNILDLYSAQNDFTSLTNTIVIQAKKAPESMISGTSLKNPWGGDVTVAVNSGNSAQFDTTQALVPAEGCVKMATGNQKIVALRINGTAQTIPVDAGTAAGACNNTTNTLITTIAR